MLLFTAYHFTVSFFQTGFLLAEEEKQVKPHCRIFNDYFIVTALSNRLNAENLNQLHCREV